jgi:CheY-like chemotaxis protein
VTARAGAIGAETVSQLAHRLRTPLAVIAGYAELLRIRTDEETRTEAPVRIQVAADRLTTAIDEVLELLSGLAEERTERTERVGRPRPDVAEGCVLVVDDDEELRELLRATVPTDGFTMLEARDGAEALDALEHEPVDLVVLDWQLPARSGAEVLRELKLRQPDLPVIVLTAEIDPRHRATAEGLGAEVFLTKPFSPLELMGQIERLLS